MESRHAHGFYFVLQNQQPWRRLKDRHIGHIERCTVKMHVAYCPSASLATLTAKKEPWREWGSFLLRCKPSRHITSGRQGLIWQLSTICKKKGEWRTKALDECRTPKRAWQGAITFSNVDSVPCCGIRVMECTNDLEHVFKWLSPTLENLLMRAKHSCFFEHRRILPR